MKKEQNSLAIFENFKIRRHFDEKRETWYFSVIDIVAALTESSNPTDYLKNYVKEILRLESTWGQIVPR